MSGLKNIAFAGGDLRNIYMANHFCNEGYCVYTFELNDKSLTSECHKMYSLEVLLNSSRIIVFPIPVSNNGCSLNIDASKSDISLSLLISNLNKKHILFGGKFPNLIINHCLDNDIPCYDFLKNDSVAIMNSIATAEGAISKAILLSPYNLHNSNCLVLGYGKCGKTIARKLASLNAKVCVAARRKESLADAKCCGLLTQNIDNIIYSVSEYQYIFNTIPDCILTPLILDNISKNTVIIDISSYPGGVDFEYAKAKNITAKLLLGIPGKVAPHTSAEILCNEIMNTIY